jgi:hypothetical protein
VIRLRPPTLARTGVVLLAAAIALATPCVASALDPPVHRRLAPLPTVETPQLERRKIPPTFEPEIGSSRPAPARVPTALDGWDAVANASPIVSPADPAGAIGPSSVVAAANVRVGVYSPGGATLVAPVRLRSLDDVVPSHGGSVPARARDTDPKVIYDAYDDMFVVVALAYTSKGDWIEVTTMPGATADDTGTCCTLVLHGDQTTGDGRQFADYPGLGFTADRITITTNNFSFDLTRFAHVQVLSLRASQLYAPGCDGPVTPRVFAAGATRNPDGSKAFSMQPAATVGGTDPATQYLVSFEAARRADRLVLWRLRAADGRLRLVRSALPIGRTKIPYYGLQEGSSVTAPTTWWDTGDERFVNAWYDADLGRVFTAHAIRHDLGSGGHVESAVRWYEVDPAARLTDSRVDRAGFIGQSGSDAAWPSLATDSAGVLYVTYSQASLANGQYLSAWVATIQPGATVAQTLLLKAGQARYDFGTPAPERWGDFSQTARDPTDGGRIAVFNAYAADDGGRCGLGGGRSCLWQEWVGIVRDA